MTRRSELRLLEQAIRNRWNITEEFKQATINRMMRIIADVNTKDRSAIAAARVIAQLEAQNQADEFKETDSLEAILKDAAEQLGIPLGDPVPTIDGRAGPAASDDADPGEQPAHRTRSGRRAEANPEEQISSDSDPAD